MLVFYNTRNLGERNLMRANIWHFVKIYSEMFEAVDPVLEIGSLQIPTQEEISNLRMLFPNKKIYRL